MSADFFAGYLSGSVGIAIGNPLDIAKVRLQAGQKATGNVTPEAATPSLRFLRGTSPVESLDYYLTLSCRCCGSHTRLRGPQRFTLYDVQSILKAPGSFDI